MQIRVGPFAYAVRLVHGHIDHQGEPCYGLCDHVRQEILLSDVPPPHQRLQVFFHELMHAWWYHFHADAGDEEAVADLVGVAMTDFLLQAVETMRCQGAELRLFDMLGAPTACQPTAAAAPGAQPRRASVTAVVPAPSAASRATSSDGWTIRIFEPSPSAPAPASGSRGAMLLSWKPPTPSPTSP